MRSGPDRIVQRPLGVEEKSAAAVDHARTDRDPDASSIRMNEPVIRFFKYGSQSSWTRPILLRPSSLVSRSPCGLLM